MNSGKWARFLCSWLLAASACDTDDASKGSLPDAGSDASVGTGGERGSGGSPPANGGAADSTGGEDASVASGGAPATGGATEDAATGGTVSSTGGQAEVDASPEGSSPEGSTLLPNGAACTTGAQCTAGGCVRQRCGVAVTSCAEAMVKAAAIVAVPGSLRNAWPTTNFRGGAALLDGDFTIDSKVCFSATQVAISFKDPSNAMVQAPADLALGQHSVFRIYSDGAVSPTMSVTITAQPELGPSVLDASGGVREAFGRPASIFVPSPVGGVEPVNNSWYDKHKGATLTLQGRLQDSPQITGYTNKLLSSDTVAARELQLDGIWDPANRRSMVKFERRCCADGTFARGGLCGSSGGYAGSTCNVQVPAWEYVAIFSCPENPLFKLPGERVVDMCAPDLHEKAKDDWGYLEIYSPRRLVFFPTKAPVPQIVLQTTYPP